MSWRLWSKRQRAEQPTADRDRFSFNRGEGARKFVGGLSGHNLAAKGGIEGCLSGRLVRPGRASTAYHYILAMVSDCFA